jgi:hypothetical protein
MRTRCRPEERGSQQAKSWSESVIQVEPWNPVGQWKGEQRQIRPDLSRVVQQRSVWQWRGRNPSNHFFPDGIILRCPERLVLEQSFSIRVILQLDEGEPQTSTANDDSKAQLIDVTHQTLSPEV